jgi:hypothetical protein
MLELDEDGQPMKTKKKSLIKITFFHDYFTVSNGW